MDKIKHRFTSLIETLEYWRGVDCLGTASFHAQQDLTLYVRPQFRRQRVGTKLLKEEIRVWNIPFERQSYTNEGAQFFHNFFIRAGQPPQEAVEKLLRARTPKPRGRALETHKPA